MVNIKHANHYTVGLVKCHFYKKATVEIKQFLSKNVYKHISKERNEVLYFIGRILPSQDGKLNLSDVCVDLTTVSFCVPLVDKFSPLAYALINEIDWYNNADASIPEMKLLRGMSKKLHILRADL